MDADDFDRMVRLHLPRLHRLATRLTGRSTDGEDVAQEALLRIARHWRSCRDATSFWSWAAAIVVNTFRDRLRARPQPARTDYESAVSSEPSAHANVVADELAERVATAVSSLPPREREVLALCFYESMDIGSVAVALGLSTQNVRTTLAHARQGIARQLGLTQEHRS
ncbi:MAG: sigma-70 family RNA polymerase sigma factor [Tepidisphaeraceae bacterium]